MSALATSVPDTAKHAVEARIAAFTQQAATQDANITALRDVSATLSRGFGEQAARIAESLSDQTARDAAVAALRSEISSQATRLADAERLLREDVAQRSRRVDDTLRFLQDRVEFVRREIMYEMRYGARDGMTAARQPAQARILSSEKIDVARAAGALRLNLGCGHIPLPDYVNVDIRELPGIDVFCDVGALPFTPGSVDEIFSAHLVEHFPQEEMARRLLPHWLRLLKPGGTLRAIAPDGAAMLAGYADGSCSFADFREVLFGSQDYEGDFHYNIFTPETFASLVESAGFTSPEIPVRGRRNGQCFEFELVARAPVPNSPTP